MGRERDNDHDRLAELRRRHLRRGADRRHVVHGQTSDEGNTIQVIETAADASNKQATATSNALVPVAVPPPPAPANTSAPAISFTGTY